MHTDYAARVQDEIERVRVMSDLDARFGSRAVVRFEQTRTAAPDLTRQAAPELVTPVELDCLPPVARLESHTLLAHPLQRGMALVDQRLDQLGIAAILREAAYILEEVLAQVLA